MKILNSINVAVVALSLAVGMSVTVAASGSSRPYPAVSASRDNVAASGMEEPYRRGPSTIAPAVLAVWAYRRDEGRRFS